MVLSRFSYKRVERMLIEGNQISSGVRPHASMASTAYSRRPPAGLAKTDQRSAALLRKDPSGNEDIGITVAGSPSGALQKNYYVEFGTNKETGLTRKVPCRDQVVTNPIINLYVKFLFHIFAV